MIGINGMAHVVLTVSNFAASREFYHRLLPEFGMKVVSDSERFFYCVGARTAIGIEPCDPALTGERLSIDALLYAARLARPSFAALPKTRGHPAITPYCSRTRTASDWR